MDDVLNQMKAAEHNSLSPQKIAQLLIKIQTDFNPTFISRNFNSNEIIQIFKQIFSFLSFGSAQTSSALRLSSYRSTGYFLVSFTPLNPNEMQIAFSDFSMDSTFADHSSAIIAASFAFLTKYIALPFLDSYLNRTPVFHHFTSSNSTFSEYLYSLIYRIGDLTEDWFINLLHSLLEKALIKEDRYLFKAITAIISRYPNSCLSELLNSCQHLGLIAYVFNTIQPKQHHLESIAFKEIGKKALSILSDGSNSFTIIDSALKIISFIPDLKITQIYNHKSPLPNKQNHLLNIEDDSTASNVADDLIDLNVVESKVADDLINFSNFTSSEQSPSNDLISFNSDLSGQSTYEMEKLFFSSPNENHENLSSNLSEDEEEILIVGTNIRLKVKDFSKWPSFYFLPLPPNLIRPSENDGILILTEKFNKLAYWASKSTLDIPNIFRIFSSFCNREYNESTSSAFQGLSKALPAFINYSEKNILEQIKVLLKKLVFTKPRSWFHASDILHLIIAIPQDRINEILGENERIIKILISFALNPNDSLYHETKDHLSDFITNDSDLAILINEIDFFNSFSLLRLLPIISLSIKKRPDLQYQYSLISTLLEAGSFYSNELNTLGSIYKCLAGIFSHSTENKFKEWYFNNMNDSNYRSNFQFMMETAFSIITSTIQRITGENKPENIKDTSKNIIFSDKRISALIEHEFSLINFEVIAGNNLNYNELFPSAVGCMSFLSSLHSKIIPSGTESLIYYIENLIIKSYQIFPRHSIRLSKAFWSRFNENQKSNIISHLITRIPMLQNYDNIANIVELTQGLSFTEKQTLILKTVFLYALKNPHSRSEYAYQVFKSNAKRVGIKDEDISETNLLDISFCDKPSNIDVQRFQITPLKERNLPDINYNIPDFNTSTFDANSPFLLTQLKTFSRAFSNAELEDYLNQFLNFNYEKRKLKNIGIKSIIRYAASKKIILTLKPFFHKMLNHNITNGTMCFIIKYLQKFKSSEITELLNLINVDFKPAFGSNIQIHSLIIQSILSDPQKFISVILNSEKISKKSIQLLPNLFACHQFDPNAIISLFEKYFKKNDNDDDISSIRLEYGLRAVRAFVSTQKSLPISFINIIITFIEKLDHSKGTLQEILHIILAITQKNGMRTIEISNKTLVDISRYLSDDHNFSIGGYYQLCLFLSGYEKTFANISEFLKSPYPSAKYAGTFFFSQVIEIFSKSLSPKAKPNDILSKLSNFTMSAYTTDIINQMLTNFQKYSYNYPIVYITSYILTYLTSFDQFEQEKNSLAHKINKLIIHPHDAAFLNVMTSLATLLPFSSIEDQKAIQMVFESTLIAPTSSFLIHGYLASYNSLCSNSPLNLQILFTNWLNNPNFDGPQYSDSLREFEKSVYHFLGPKKLMEIIQNNYFRVEKTFFHVYSPLAKIIKSYVHGKENTPCEETQIIQMAIEGAISMVKCRVHKGALRLIQQGRYIQGINLAKLGYDSPEGDELLKHYNLTEFL